MVNCIKAQVYEIISSIYLNILSRVKRSRDSLFLKRDICGLLLNKQASRKGIDFHMEIGFPRDVVIIRDKSQL